MSANMRKMSWDIHGHPENARGRLENVRGRLDCQGRPNRKESIASPLTPPPVFTRIIFVPINPNVPPAQTPPSTHAEPFGGSLQDRLG